VGWWVTEEARRKPGRQRWKVHPSVTESYGPGKPKNAAMERRRACASRQTRAALRQECGKRWCAVRRSVPPTGGRRSERQAIRRPKKIRVRSVGCKGNADGNGRSRTSRRAGAAMCMRMRVTVTRHNLTLGRCSPRHANTVHSVVLNQGSHREWPMGSAAALSASTTTSRR
jgi:hypothetical protein